MSSSAISFFPDYERAPEEAFVYLQNEGGMNFTAYTFAQAQDARWWTMDAGDVDSDGDADIVLGAFVRGASNVSKELEQRWQRHATSVLILRNRLH